MTRYVVDTSVARAAGSTPDAPTPSPECTDVLLAIQKSGGRAVFNRSLLDEWDKHKGRYASQWLSQMFSRSRIERINDDWKHSGDVIAAAAELSPVAARSVRKDIDLVELAMQTDRNCISLDDKQRAYLADVAKSVSQLGALSWASPRHPQCVPWIEDHAGNRKLFALQP